jgi:NosR/NirI family nitrous oxide reductase transcriptional regulator
MKYFDERLAIFRTLSCLLILAVQLVVAPSATAQTYEAPLPAQVSTDPNLCAFVPCLEVIPGADSFSERKGKPSYVEAYKTEEEDGKDAKDRDDEHEKEKKLVGYVFLSTDIVDIPAYSGKPVVTLIGMDTKGFVTGAKILRHSEPILLLGIPEAELTKFIDQYVGKFVGDKIEIGKGHEAQGVIGLDAISGATVTVIAQNQVMLRSGIEIARQVGIIKPTIRKQAVFTDIKEPLSWNALIKEGSVKRLTVSPDEVGMEGEGPYIDMYFGYLNAPAVGKSVLGEYGYNSLMSRLKPGEQAIFIISNGMDSFKGSGFVRGGIYDRVQVAQDMDTFTFRDLDYLNLYGVEAENAPAYREAGIFIIRGTSFSGAYPWSLVFLANKVDKQTGERTFTSFDKEYWLPERYLVGGRPVVERADPVWLKIWKDKSVTIVFFVLFLGATALIYGLRDKLVRRATRRDKRWVSIPKYFIWITSLIFVGYYLMAQPSITHVLTWFHSLVYKWQWELFLSDPFIFIFWWFIIITVFFWGRGLFCGWLCPYGALTELVHKLASKIGLKRFQFHLPVAMHDKLKWLKYAIFFVLLGVSFYSMGTAEKMAEVEPFKTTFLVGVLNRTWPYILFWVSLIGLSVFMQRPFCKYLCPLGAGLAIPSTFRIFGLKRKHECGTSCKACEVGCGAIAIDETGRIDQRECLLCLDCMVLYYDSHSCPPLVHERKVREKAGLPLTPISAQGYYIPIKDITHKT